MFTVFSYDRTIEAWSIVFIGDGRYVAYFPVVNFWSRLDVESCEVRRKQ